MVVVVETEIVEGKFCLKQHDTAYFDDVGYIGRLVIVVVLEAAHVADGHFHDPVPGQKVNHHEDGPLVRCTKKHRSVEVVARDALLAVVLAAVTAEIN